MTELKVGNRFAEMSHWYKEITEIVCVSKDGTHAIVRYTEDDGLKGISHMKFEDGLWKSWIETPDRGQVIDEKEKSFMLWQEEV